MPVTTVRSIPSNTVHVSTVGLTPVAPAAIDVLRQCTSFLAGLSDAHYTHASVVLPSGTIGKHVRHLLDHFAAPLFTPAGETVDYDHRARNTPDETSRDAAMARADECVKALGRCTIQSEAAPITIRVMLAPGAPDATLATTLGRELAFAAHHAHHHLAMIAAICREIGVPVPAELGKAPSTIAYEKAEKR